MSLADDVSLTASTIAAAAHDPASHDAFIGALPAGAVRRGRRVASESDADPGDDWFTLKPLSAALTANEKRPANDVDRVLDKRCIIDDESRIKAGVNLREFITDLLFEKIRPKTGVHCIGPRLCEGAPA